MNFDGILRISPQGFHDYVLFDPFEEYFDVPTMAIEIGNLQCADLKIVRYEIHNTIIYRVIQADEPHILRIEFAWLMPDDPYARVFQYSGLLSRDSHLLNGDELHIHLWTRDPKGLCLMELEESLEIHISLIHYIKKHTVPA